MDVTDPFVAAGATPVSLSTAPTGSQDPYITAGAVPAPQDASQGPSDDDFANAGASLADPDAIRSKMTQNPAYYPNDQEWKTLYDNENSKSAAQKTGEFIEGAAEVIPETLESAVGAVQELANKPSAAQLASTAVDAAGNVGKGLSSLVTGPLNYLGHTLPANLWDKASGNPDAVFQRWKNQQMTQLAESRSSIGQDFLQAVGDKNAPAPLPNTSAIASTIGMLALPLGGEAATADKLVGAGENALVKGAITRSQEAAAKGVPVLPPTTAEQALQTAGQVVQTAGGVAKTVGALPRKAISAVAEKIVGPELAEKASGLLEGVGGLEALSHGAEAGILPHLAAGAAALEGGGGALQKAGELVQTIAQTPTAGPFGRLLAMAKDSDTPDWIKSLTTIPGVQALSGAIDATPKVLGSAAKGGALGAGLGFASGQDPEQAGETAGGFAGFGALHGFTFGRKTALFQNRIDGMTQLVSDNLNAKVAPEVLAKVPDMAMLAAADLKKLIPATDTKGQPFQILYYDKASMPGDLYQSTEGHFNPDTNQLWLNADKLAANPDAYSAVFHEAIGHAMWDSDVVNQPAVKAELENLLKSNGSTLDDVKNDYSRALLEPSFKKSGITDPVEQQKQIKAQTAAQDNQSLARFGDKDAWIHQELLAEGARNALGGSKWMSSPEGSLNKAVSAYSSNALLQKLKNIGLSDRQGDKPGTFFSPKFAPVLQAPEMRSMVYKLVKAQRDYIPGVTKKAKQAVTLKQSDIGGEKLPVTGQTFQDYLKETKPGSGDYRVRPVREQKQIEKNWKVLMEKHYPTKGVRALGPKDQTAPVALKQTPGGKYERRGTELGDKFYNDPNISQAMKERAAAMEKAIKDGNQWEGWYNKTHKNGVATVEDLETEWKHGLQPYEFFIDKQGHLLTRLYDFGKLREDILPELQHRQGDYSLEPWGGDVDKALTDAKTYLKNHAEGKPGAEGIGEQKRNILNAAIFGRNAEYAERNPLRKKLRGSEAKNGIVRSYRLDRLESLHQEPNEFPKAQWEKGKFNYTPAVAETSSNRQLGTANRQITPDDLKPALLVDGKPITGGASHADIMQRIIKQNPAQGMKALGAFMQDSSHIFTDKAGKVYTRAEAAQALGLHEPLQSNVLTSLQTPKIAGLFSPATATDKEHIVQAAIKLPNGKVYSGSAHYFAYMNGETAGMDEADALKAQEGFLTSKGRFVDRDEAFKLGKSAGQFNPEEYKDANDFNADNPEALESVAFNRVRQFSPEATQRVAQFSPETIKGQKEPNEDVRKIATGYMQQAKLPYTPHEGNEPVNETLAKHIADFYQDARHAPADPAIKASYDAFVRETRAQWDYITSQGVKMEPWTKKGQPYKTSADMMADVKDNKHLWYFPTEGGFGSTDVQTHPLLAPSGVKVNDKDVPVNDLFRAVHDYFGHSKEGYEFGPRGEYNAYLTHSRMYSDAARPAMAAETLGQNSWVNFGQHLRNAEGNIPKKGEPGFVPAPQRPFAEQKATILPPELVNNKSKDINKLPMFSPQSKVTAWVLPNGKVKPLETTTHEADLAENSKAYNSKFGTHFKEPVTEASRLPALMAGFTRIRNYNGRTTVEANPKFWRSQEPVIANHLLKHVDDIDHLTVNLVNDNGDLIDSVYGKIFDADNPELAIERTLSAVEIRPAPSNGPTKNGPTLIQQARAYPEPVEDAQFSPGAESPTDEQPKAPVYYSSLEKVIGQKFQGKEMPAAQLAAMLRNPQNGVKADEFKWSGLDDFLKGKSRVTREEVQNFLAQNNVKVKEVVRGGYTPSEDEINTYMADEAGEGLSREEAKANLIEQNTDNVPATKFEQYQLPGGSNYREILFQLPGGVDIITNENSLVSAKQNLAHYERSLRNMKQEQPNNHVQIAALQRGLERNQRDIETLESRLKDLKATKQPGQFRGSHWDEPNVLAHARLDDREDVNGNPGLFAEEIQSDWHQRGRKEGYAGRKIWKLVSNDEREGRPEVFESKKAAEDALKNLNRPNYKIKEFEANNTTTSLGVPDAPFKTSWHEFVFRRLVRMAAEEGKDWLGWTTGEQQAERYDLSKQVDSISASRNKEGQYNLIIWPRGAHGVSEVIKQTVPEEKLADTVGKELAEKITSQKGAKQKAYSGLDLKVGGEGMKGFYDKILVDYANKFGKKFGAKVGERYLAPDNGMEVERSGQSGAYRSKFTVHVLPITPEMKKSVLQEGVSLFSPGAENASNTETPNLRRSTTPGKKITSPARMKYLAARNSVPTQSQNQNN